MDVPNVTEAQRIQRIKELLKKAHQLPPDNHEVIRVPVPGNEPVACHVITMRVDEVVLNPHSHRVRAQLEDDPEWGGHKADPYSDAAQAIVQRYVRRARDDDKFAELKASLASEGQIEPGVITSDGVLINANTRAVALRELEDTNKKYIRVAVLPETVQPDELAFLELRLQMQKDLKEDYTFTNELLFIEELSSEQKVSDAQIAKELRLKGGATEVRTRLQLLDLIRRLQTMPTDRLRLTFFDDLSYEQLKELHRAHTAVVDTDPLEARRILEAFLLSAAVGIFPVHRLREIDPDFMSTYLPAHLQEHDMVGRYTSDLIGLPSEAVSKPAGVSALADDYDDEPANETDTNIRGLLNLVTQRDHKVVLKTDAGPITFERDEIKEALKEAITNGVTEKKRDKTASNKLNAPIDQMKAAASQVAKCKDSCKAVVGTPEFDESMSKTLEAAFKRLQKNVKALGDELAKGGVIKS